MSLTLRSYLLAAFITLLGILGQWLEPIPVEAWRIPAAALLMLLLAEGLDARRLPLPLRRELPPRVKLGRADETRLHLDNPHRRPLQLQLVETPPEGGEAALTMRDWSIAVGAVGTLATHFLPSRLGDLDWPGPRLRLRGRFGLAWWNRRPPAEAAASTPVVPDHLRGNEYRIGSSENGERLRPRAGRGFELFDQRAYQPGDPLHAIDWKASARSGRTTVRRFSEEQHLELLILIDCGRGSRLGAGRLQRFGHYANIAARLGERALLNGDRLSLLAYADGILAEATGLRGRSGLLRARALLESLRPSAHDANPLPAALRARHLARRRSLVVLLSDLDDDLQQGQLLRAIGLLRPQHQPLLGCLEDEEVAAMHSEHGEEWLSPYRNLAAEELQRRHRGARLQLQRLGVEVVSALPERLDGALMGRYEALRRRL